MRRLQDPGALTEMEAATESQTRKRPHCQLPQPRAAIPRRRGAAADSSCPAGRRLPALPLPGCSRASTERRCRLQGNCSGHSA